MPYDQESLEYGMKFGFVCGVFAAAATAGFVYVTRDSIRWYKNLRNEK